MVLLAGGHRADSTALLLPLPGHRLWDVILLPVGLKQRNLRAGTEGCLCVLKVEEMCLDKARVLGSHQVYKAKRSSHIREHKCLEALMGNFP